MPRRRAARKMVSPSRMSTSRLSMLKVFALVVIRSSLASALILRDARTPIRACETDGAHALLRMRARAYLTPRLKFRLMVKSRAQPGVSNHGAALHFHHQLP